MEKNWHVWSSYSNSGRPDRFIGSFETWNEATKAMEACKEDNPCDSFTIIYDPEGDGTYDEEGGWMYFK